MTHYRLAQDLINADDLGLQLFDAPCANFPAYAVETFAEPLIAPEPVAAVPASRPAEVAAGERVYTKLPPPETRVPPARIYGSVPPVPAHSNTRY